MNIFKFKHSASSENKNKANKIDIKEINGFTFVEVILVMALISFLYIVTMKVIQHNLDQKVPVYVYNLYKNLDNESKLLTKKLIEEANSSEGGGSGSNSNKKTIDDVLKGMNAKTYCQAFANDANLIGDADCENSIKNIETSKSESKSLTYNCQRTYKFNVYSDGKYNETFTPSYDANLPQCKDNQNFDDDTISCNAKPTEKIANLMLNNTQNYHTYICGNKSETVDNNETKPDVATFSIDTKQKIQKSLKTTNNVHLNFVTLKQENSKTFIKYNLNAIINQDEICPVISRAKFNTSNAITCSINFSTYNLSGKSDTTNDIMYKRRPYFFHCLKTTGFLKPTLPGTHMEENGPYGLSATIPQITQTCAGYIKHAKEMSKFKEIDFTDYKEKKLWNGKVASINCNSYIEKNENKKIIQDCTMEPPASNIALLYINVKLNSKTILDSDSQKFNHKGYYTKWDTFFNTKENGKYIFTKETKAAITPDNSLKEGSVETTLGKTSSNINDYLAHFIYATIDTSFEKGEMGKNIFVFEQFGSKIIPVGYLANNQNTPLKFDVITRNQDSFKIEKANYKNGMEKRPLTFCVAMKYTGEKFSQYCGCKDANDKIVTQYTKIATCDNKFGCIIRPVQPSSVK